MYFPHQDTDYLGTWGSVIYHMGMGDSVLVVTGASSLYQSIFELIMSTMDSQIFKV